MPVRGTWGAAVREEAGERAEGGGGRRASEVRNVWVAQIQRRRRAEEGRPWRQIWGVYPSQGGVPAKRAKFGSPASACAPVGRGPAANECPEEEDWDVER
eukprot:4089003-Prymnesium_polylepis.1